MPISSSAPGGNLSSCIPGSAASSATSAARSRATQRSKTASAHYSIWRRVYAIDRFQGLDQRPDPPGHQSHPSRDAPSRRRRTRDRPSQVIGHLKDDHRMRRNYLKGRDGDRINAVLAAAGFNFSLLLRWFAELLRVLLLILCRHLAPPHLA